MVMIKGRVSGDGERMCVWCWLEDVCMVMIRGRVYGDDKKDVCVVMIRGCVRGGD